MMTRAEILQHYKNFFDLNEMGTGEDDMIHIDWAESLLEDTEVVNKNDLLLRVTGWLSIEQCAVVYGKEIKYKWLSPDGNDWLDKKGKVDARVLREMEQGSIKEACL